MGDLPAALWEAVADRLPIPGVMSLRQAWRGASQLASARVRSEASAKLQAELGLCVRLCWSAAGSTAEFGIPSVLEETGRMELNWLSSFMIGIVQGVSVKHGDGRKFELASEQFFLARSDGMRCTYALQPRHADVLVQVRAGAVGPVWCGASATL